MSDKNLVGIPFKDQESFFKLRAMIGSIYDSMNREHQPKNNHVADLLDPALVEFMKASTPNPYSSFGR